MTNECSMQHHKINNQHKNNTLDFSGTWQGKGCNLFILSLMQGWRMNETKTEWNLLLVFYLSPCKMKYIFWINSAKGKGPTPGQFYFPFLPDKRQSWWMHLNVGLNAYSFDLLCSNNFSKWIKFGYGGNMCTWLYIHSWLYISVLWWCRTQISGEQKTLKRYCKRTRMEC